MTYSDSNPERRNLVVLSFAIIIFYLSGAKLQDDYLKLAFINVSIEDITSLIIIVWCMLGWFLFRYVITNHKKYAVITQSETTYTNLSYPFVIDYVKSNANRTEEFNLNKAYLTYDTNDVWYLFDNSKRMKAALQDTKGKLIIIFYLLKIAHKHRATTDYLTPYILFSFAVLLGINNSLYNFTHLIPAALFLILIIIINLYYMLTKNYK